MANTNISNNVFTGVHYSDEHANSLKVIAEGLTETAKAFHTLAKVLASSEVHIEALVKINENSEQSEKTNPIEENNPKESEIVKGPFDLVDRIMI